MRYLIAVALLAAGLTLAACGSGSGGSKPSSPSALATKIGCTGFASMTPTLYAREEGTCKLSGDDLDIATFSSAGNESSWLKVAGSFGGIYVHGNLWAVGVGTQSSADAVKSALGGTQN